MKFPFDFNITLIFRLVFPGVVLALAAMPFFLGFFAWVGLKKIEPSILFPVLAVIFGWLIVLCDQPIYMLMEGRRYSPSWLRDWLRERQVRRLENIVSHHRELKNQGEGARAAEVNLGKLDYPVNSAGDFHAPMPTRMGNLLYAYETYPKTAYGLDSIFYWYRLWLVLDKDLKADLGETQAIADSPVYVCFASYASCAIVFLYALGGFAARTLHPALFNLPYLPSPEWTLALGLFPLCLGYVLYRVSLFAQRSYGELYKSLFDQFRDKLAFVDDAVAIAVTRGAGMQEAADDRYTVASRYLRWHKIRPPGGQNITPEEWARQRAAGPGP